MKEEPFEINDFVDTCLVTVKEGATKSGKNRA